MDILLLIIASVLIITGIAGCVLPVLPGPPISYVGLLVLHFTSYADFSTTILLLLGIAAAGVTVLDYVIPVWGTKKFGGSKYGQWGATIGMIVGLFFGPLGIILGPFVGALVGELVGGSPSGVAMKSAIGSLLGFLLGVGVKLVVSGIITYYFVKELWMFFAV